MGKLVSGKAIQFHSLNHNRTLPQMLEDIKLDPRKLEEAMFNKPLPGCKIDNYRQNTITHVAYQLAAASKAIVHGHGME